MDKVHNLSQLNVSGYSKALPRHSKVGRDNSVRAKKKKKNFPDGHCYPVYGEVGRDI